jgi:hypothetical protein
MTPTVAPTAFKSDKRVMLTLVPAAATIDLPTMLQVQPTLTDANCVLAGEVDRRFESTLPH